MRELPLEINHCILLWATLVKPEGTQSLEKTKQAAACDSYQEVGVQNILWRASQVDCTCLGEPAVCDLQGKNDEHCPYCICTEKGRETAMVTSKSWNGDCTVCALMNKLNTAKLVGLGPKKQQMTHCYAGFGSVYCAVL